MYIHLYNYYFYHIYIHDDNNAFVVKYKYTPNNCTQASVPGTEPFTPKH